MAEVSYSGIVTVSSDAVEGKNTINCSGVGTSQETRIINLGGNLDFGNVDTGAKATRTLTINNNGSTVLKISDIKLPEGFSANWKSGDIDPGGSRSTEITFAPLTLGTFEGALEVISNAIAGDSKMICKGVGVKPPNIYTIMPGIAEFTNCHDDDLWKSCKSTTFYGDNFIKATVLSVNSTSIVFRVEKCSGNFSYSGTMYVVENDLCGSAVSQVTYSPGVFYRDISIPNSLSTGQAINYYLYIKTDNSAGDKYYAKPLYISRK